MHSLLYSLVSLYTYCILLCIVFEDIDFKPQYLQYILSTFPLTHSVHSFSRNAVAVHSEQGQCMVEIVGILYEWISLSFSVAGCQSFLVWQERSSISNNPKPVFVIVLFTGPSPQPRSLEWMIGNSSSCTQTHHLSQALWDYFNP